MGLDVYFEPSDGREAPESKVNPNHLFQVDYWRSSYNDGGINSILRNQGLPDLWEIAGVTSELVEASYEETDGDDGGGSTLTLDWAKVAARAKEAEIMLSSGPTYGVMWAEARNHRDEDPTIDSDRLALQVVTDKLAKHAGRDEPPMGLTFDAFSTSQGFFDFSDEGLRVVGVIKGIGFGGPGHYLVYRLSDEVQNHYIESLRIIQETAAWGQEIEDDGETLYVTWSH